MVSPPIAPAPARAPAPIDPRIRARRIDVQRREGRRRLQRLVDLGLVLVVAAGFVGALWTPLLDVDSIEIDGASRSGVEAVRTRAGIELGERLIDVDLRSAGERIASLPWAGEVSLRRRVDGVVDITVRERVPVATIGTGTAAMLVDRAGRVLGPVASQQSPPLPALLGVGEVPPAGSFLDDGLEDALLLAERLHDAVPGAVTAVAAAPLVALLAQGGEARFGALSQLDAKVRSLRTVLAQVDLRCLAVLDLGLPGSPVLTREQRCS